MQRFFGLLVYTRNETPLTEGRRDGAGMRDGSIAIKTMRRPQASTPILTESRMERVANCIANIVDNDSKFYNELDRSHRGSDSQPMRGVVPPIVLSVTIWRGDAVG